MQPFDRGLACLKRPRKQQAAHSGQGSDCHLLHVPLCGVLLFCKVHPGAEGLSQRGVLEAGHHLQARQQGMGGNAFQVRIANCNLSA